jgi:hypothetical protein
LTSASTVCFIRGIINITKLIACSWEYRIISKGVKPVVNGVGREARKYLNKLKLESLFRNVYRQTDRHTDGREPFRWVQLP